MEKSYLENKVKGIVAESLTVAFDEVTLGAELVGDFGADSLDLIEALMNVEAEFDIEISDQESKGIVTVSDLVGVVASHTT